MPHFAFVIVAFYLLLFFLRPVRVCSDGVRLIFAYSEQHTTPDTHIALSHLPVGVY